EDSRLVRQRVGLLQPARRPGRLHRPVVPRVAEGRAGNLPGLEDLPLQSGTRVLVRADFNVPLSPGGAIEDDMRIRAALPTIDWLLGRGAAVIACSHLGRPKGAPDPKYSLAPVAARLGEMLGAEVPLAPEVVGEEASAMAAGLAPGTVMVLENLRFEPGETTG